MLSNVTRVEGRVDARRRADEFREVRSAAGARPPLARQQRILEGMWETVTHGEREKARAEREGVDVCYREG